MTRKMKVIETFTRFLNLILCAANIGSLFYGLMLLSGMGNEIYGFFRNLSISLCFPMFAMRLVYLQYILWGIIALFTVICAAHRIKKGFVTKKGIAADCILWAVAIAEIICLESYFLAISTF